MNKEINYVSPFKKLCITVGNLPTAYIESMSYYEGLTFLVNYLSNNVIPALNNNGEVVEELQQKFTELKNYVDTYFENLDVQEEINNKLDEMTLDGSLTLLIKNYVDPLYEAYENEINEEITNIQSDINEFKTSVNDNLSSMRSEIDVTQSGSPLVATSTSEMIDTSRVYVNTTDGNWYYYDGDSWEIGGTYQSSGIADNSITLAKLSYQFKSDSDNLLDETNAIVNKKWAINEPVTSDEMITDNLYESFPAMNVEPGQVLIPLYEDGSVYDRNLDQIIWYDSAGQYVNVSFKAPSTFPITVPPNIYYAKLTTQKAYHLAQIKLYDSGNYNPKYEPYKYISKIVLDEDIAYLDNFNKLNPTYTDNSYIFSNPELSDRGKQCSDQYSSTFSSTDFIPVTPGMKIKLSNIWAVSNTGACAYNINKNYVATIVYNTSSTDIDYTVPSGVYYIRYTIKTAKKDDVTGGYYNIDYKSTINKLEKIGLNVYNLCNTYANKPVLTLIDDDCNSSSIPTIKSICDDLNVKCTFACITKNLDSTLIDTLKSYQEEGYHITSHTNSHDRWYKNTVEGDMFTIDECQTDLIKSLVKLDENQFLDNDYIVAPGTSYSRVGIDKIINKWAKCFVANTYNAVYNNLYNPNQFKIARTMLNADSHNLQYYKDWINTAYENNSWIILGTHSYNSDEFDGSLYEEIISYAISKGFEVKTLNEAFKERKLIYDMKDLFN